MAGTRTPRLFTIAPGVPFLPTLVRALCDGDLVPGFRFDRADPLALSRATIYVPTRRAARALRSEFVDHIGRTSAILPTIRPLGETDDDAGYFDLAEPSMDQQLPVGKVETLLELASLVQRWKNKLPQAVSGFHRGSPLIAPASPADAIWLARGLADLLDAMETHDCPWQRLDLLQAADHAEWWQLTLEFLKIASAFWPARLREIDRVSAASHRNAALAAETRRLASMPEKGPMIVAGSTGSIPATAALMQAIAGLDQGAIVLPGLDTRIPPDVWPLVMRAGADETDPAVLTHPQYGLALLLSRFGAAREDVVPLGEEQPVLAARNAAISMALLPARATALWAAAPFAGSPQGFGDVSLIETSSEREEAAAIAVAMRIAGDDPKARVALVTPDRRLARRVSVELVRYGIEANDSGGVPLASTQPATLLRLLLDAVMQPGDPVALTGLLSHPLARFGLSMHEARRAAHLFELLALRGRMGEVDVSQLSALLESGLREDGEARHIPEWRRRLSQDDIALARRLALEVETRVEPLTGRFIRFASAASGRMTDHAPISAWARDTIDVAEAVTGDPDTGVSGLWGEEAGEALAALFADMLASRADLPASGAEWADIVAALIAGETVKPRATTHPRIFIWGALEARLQDVDTLILAGLNEGKWPGQTANDAFLSRPMKMTVGLEPQERRIGLAAHDFQMAMGASKVILSRSTRADKAPTVASRWLQRLLAVVGDEGALAMRRRGDALRLAAEAADQKPERPLANRPEPKPPLVAQPKRYSFSEIRTLRRDPYAVYARRVLRLSPLDGLIRDPGVAERGTLYHAIVERFIAEGAEVASADAAERLEAVAKALFDREALPHHIEVLWHPRFRRIAALFLDWERQRDGDVAERYTELRGSVPILSTGVTLSGIADRIDLMRDGSAEIIDFKTGGMPTRAQARALLDPQLPLEAAALMAGGFGDLGRKTPSSLKYVRLKDAEIMPVDSLEGADRAGRDDGSVKSAADLGSESLSRLAGFIELLASGRRGFASRIIPASAREFGGEYDHLARVAEWASADVGGDEGDAS
ncbi:double-strand break repair protein AddB [Pararhizobium haloflavum]|uniref:double-strand break repair protein AddB n=1 Tax=Pararhizobium haloflavum TaxID=2037914 RepID=UPI000C18A969|nr:double-strand break repair protein AddB [Pararhizobium haloflavum]